MELTIKHLIVDFWEMWLSVQPLVAAELTLTGLVLELVEERVELQAAQQRQAGTALATAATQRQGMPEQGQRTSQVPSRELHTHHAQ